MSNKKYYWLKLKEDFFRQKEIKKLRKIAGGDTYTVIYLKMLLIAMKHENKIYFDGVEDNFAEELSLELDENIDNVKMTLAFLQNQKLIEMIDEDEYLLPQCKTMTGVESASAERVRKHRNKNKEKQDLLQCNTVVTKGNTEIEKEKELELEIEPQPEKENEKMVVDKIKNYFLLEKEDLKKITNAFVATNKDINYLVEKLELTKNNPNTRDIVGYLISALKNDYKASINNYKCLIPKIRSNKFNDGTNNTFLKYSPEELERILQENQKNKFN